LALQKQRSFPRFRCWERALQADDLHKRTICDDEIDGCEANYGMTVTQPATDD
jgi:hypothetical protein